MKFIDEQRWTGKLATNRWPFYADRGTNPVVEPAVGKKLPAAGAAAPVLDVADSGRSVRARHTWCSLSATAAACALGLGGMTLAAGSPAHAATRPVACPSTACDAVGSGLGSTVGIALDGRGDAYTSNPDGTLHKVVLATGATTQVASGLGNLRGLALDGQGNAYTVDFG